MVRTHNAESLIGIVTGLMKELHPDASRYIEITLDSGLDRDLGLDSLSRMELLSRLEKAYDVRLSENALVNAETVRDVQRALEQARPQNMTVVSQKNGMNDDTSSRREVGLSGAATLIDVLGEHVRIQPEAGHIVLVDGEDELSISYGMLQRESLKVAVRLREINIGYGDTVAIMLPTSPDYFHSFFGVLYCGAIPVPLYPPARPTQIEEHVRRHRKILSNAGAKVLITVAEVRAVARLIMSQVPDLVKILTLDDLYSEHIEHVPLSHKEQDIAFLQYTSGSTGDPKGVILTHANLLANIRAMGRVCEVTPQDVFVSWLPLYHDMGLIGAWFGSLYHGCRLVVMSPLSFLARPERWLRSIERFRGTLSASPNFGYEICATRLDDADLDGLDLSSWRMAFNGAETVIPATMRRFEQRFKNYGLQEGVLSPVYGLAESSVGLVFPKPAEGVRIDRVRRDEFSGSGKAIIAQQDDTTALEFISSGSPLPGHQVRVVDDQNREIPEREEGRLQFKGPSATSGYYRNQDETRSLFCGDWLETGDLGYIASGEVYLTGRQKDIIIRGGRNIYPHELEEAIGDIDGIRKGCTAVFASRDKESAETLIVLSESRKRNADDLQLLKKRINEVTIELLGMGPDEIIISLPGTVLKTSSGKIRRSACRQLYESGLIGRKKATVRIQLLRMGLASVLPTLKRLFSRVGAVFYAVYCWFLLAVGGALVWCLMMVTPRGKSCWKIAGTMVRLLCRMAGITVHVEGIEKYPAGRQCILVSNHMSYLDSIILTGVLPEYVGFVAKAELAKNIFLRPALKKLGVFLVDRFDAAQGKEDTQRIKRGLLRGIRPLFFAEGTLQRMPGLLPFHMGAFVLSCDEKLPVVPVIIQGSRNILRAGAWFPRRARVQVTIGSSCEPTGSDWRAAIELRDTVRRVMLKRLGEPDLAGEYTSLLQMDLQLPGEKPE